MRFTHLYFNVFKATRRQADRPQDQQMTGLKQLNWKIFQIIKKSYTKLLSSVDIYINFFILFLSYACENCLVLVRYGKKFLSDYIESILFLFIIMTSGDLSTEISTFFVGEEQILFKLWLIWFDMFVFEVSRNLIDEYT